MEGHFLIKIDCSSCKKESFNFESFGELALDLANFEKNKNQKTILKTRFQQISNQSGRPNFFNSFSNRFDVQSDFNGLLSMSENEANSSNLKIKQSNKNQEYSKGSQSNSFESDAIHSFNSSSSSNGNSKSNKESLNGTYQRIDSNTKPKNFAIKRRNLRLNSTPDEEAYPDIFLKNLIEDFFEEEYICDFRCSHCNEKTMIRKQYRILKEPEILRLTIKRFINFPKMKKISRPIFIDKEEFDLKPFLFKYDNICQSLIDIEESLFESKVERKNPNLSYNNSESFNRSISLRKMDYELMSYIEHMGTLNEGHYVAFIKDSDLNKSKNSKNENWIAMNDDRVFEVKNHSRKLIMYNTSIYSIFLKKKRHSF
jgi:ubiquitin C-terminal hydrolase